MAGGGIQIPTLKRLDPVAPAAEPRITAKAPDESGNVAKQTAAITNLGEEAIRFSNKIENEAIDTEATKQAAEFEVNWKRGMYGDGETPGVKYQNGNPTELYAKFDDDMKGKYDAVLANENYTDRMKGVVSQRLTDTYNRLQYQRIAEQGRQQSEYETNVTNAAVENEKNNLATATAFIDPKKPETMAMFDDTVGRIRDLRLKGAIKTGGAQVDENGKSMMIGEDGKPVRINVGPVADYELKKDLSEGIYNAMDNLVKSGSIDAARAMKEKYGSFIDPVKMKSFETDYEKADTKDQAYKAVDSVRGKGSSTIDKTFEGLEPEVRDEAYKILDDRQRRQEQIRDRQSKQNSNYLSNHINQVMRSKNPYAGPTDLENDPIFSNAIRNVSDAKQKQALYDMVLQPKQSNEQAQISMQKLFFGDDPNESPRGMSPEDFNVKLSGLNRADRAKWQRRYEAMNSETSAQEEHRYRVAGKDLTDQLLSVNYIKKDGYNRVSGKDELKLIAARNEMEEYLDKQSGTPMNQKELNDFVRTYAVSKAKGEAFKAPERVVFQGGQTAGPGTKVAKNAPPPGNTDASGNDLIKGRTKLGWVKEFQAQNNGKLPGLTPKPGRKTSELQDFIDEQD